MRAIAIWLVSSLAVLLSPATAGANGDPASDVLLQSKIYFPTQRVGPPEAANLQKIVNSANAKGYAIRVALIEDASDLGTVPNLLNQPQKYAEFLGPEIRFVYKGDLLVVMPTGLGLTTTKQTIPPAKAIEGMQVEAGGSPNGLALTAGAAVTALAKAAGHPIAGSTKSTDSGSGALVGIIVAAVLLALGLGGAFWVRRSAPRATAGGEPAQNDDTA